MRSRRGLRERRQWSVSAEDAQRRRRRRQADEPAVALLALPLLALCAPPAIRILFGAEFADATDALGALLPAAVAMAWWRALSAGLLRFGRAVQVNAMAFCALVVNVALNLVADRAPRDQRGRARVAGELHDGRAARRRGCSARASARASYCPALLPDVRTAPTRRPRARCPAAARRSRTKAADISSIRRDQAHVSASARHRARRPVVGGERQGPFERGKEVRAPGRAAVTTGRRWSARARPRPGSASTRRACPSPGTRRTSWAPSTPCTRSRRSGTMPTSKAAIGAGQLRWPSAPRMRTFGRLPEAAPTEHLQRAHEAPTSSRGARRRGVDQREVEVALDDRPRSRSPAARRPASACRSAAGRAAGSKSSMFTAGWSTAPRDRCGAAALGEAGQREDEIAGRREAPARSAASASGSRDALG